MVLEFGPADLRTKREGSLTYQVKIHKRLREVQSLRLRGYVVQFGGGAAPDLYYSLEFPDYVSQSVGSNGQVGAPVLYTGTAADYATTSDQNIPLVSQVELSNHPDHVTIRIRRPAASTTNMEQTLELTGATWALNLELRGILKQ